MSDVVVVIPGIGGSQLATEDGAVLWNTSWVSFAKQAASWGRRFERLTLHSDNDADGVRATRLVDGLTVIPGFWSYGSYAPLTAGLRRRFGAANVTEFAYDWRRSNDHSAAKLADLIRSLGVEREDRRVVLVAHSMGGIVARRYLTHHGGGQRCRLLITIGTPYQGAVKALDRLANGIPKVPATFGLRLTTFLRACPSVYELLPRYGCFEKEGSQRYGLNTWRPDGIDPGRFALARKLHAEVDAEIAKGMIEAVDSVAVIGHRQETARYATVTDNRLELRPELWVGDGTVPEGSAKPPEWGRTVRGTIPFWATHLDLASNKAVFRTVEGLILGEEFSDLGPAGDDGLSISLPEVATPDEAITVRVRTRDDRLAVTASIEDDSMAIPAARHLIATRGVRLGNDELTEYEGRLGPLSPGVHHVVVRAVTAGSPHSVSGTVTVFAVGAGDNDA
jgi:pimeloyl-ACP methyl ester carboxylesterase